MPTCKERGEQPGYDGAERRQGLETFEKGIPCSTDLKREAKERRFADRAS